MCGHIGQGQLETTRENQPEERKTNNTRKTAWRDQRRPLVAQQTFFIDDTLTSGKHTSVNNKINNGWCFRFEALRSVYLLHVHNTHSCATCTLNAFVCVCVYTNTNKYTHVHIRDKPTNSLLSITWTVKGNAARPEGMRNMNKQLWN